MSKPSLSGLSGAPSARKERQEGNRLGAFWGDVWAFLGHRISYYSRYLNKANPSRLRTTLPSWVPVLGMLFCNLMSVQSLVGRPSSLAFPL